MSKFNIGTVTREELDSMNDDQLKEMCFQLEEIHNTSKESTYERWKKVMDVIRSREKMTRILQNKPAERDWSDLDLY